MKTRIMLFFLSLILMMSSCAQKNDKNDYVIKIKTDYGEIVAILYDETPKHKENFIKLAKEKYYDSLLFHRVIPGFMIQGGDPDSKNAEHGQHLGLGGPGYTIEAEFRPQFFHVKGALAAARMNDDQNPTKASNGSQFYIVEGTVINPDDVENLKINSAQLNKGFQIFTSKPENKQTLDSLMQIYSSGDMVAYQKKVMSLVPVIEKQTGLKITKEVPKERIDAYTTIGGAPHLDDEYTVFGKIIKGLEVVEKLATVPRDSRNRPHQDIRMYVTVEEMPRNKITKEYGYEYPKTN
jgi:cyclophilin family peptidyl-prolyl cis-trans isomerase